MIEHNIYLSELYYVFMFNVFYVNNLASFRPDLTVIVGDLADETVAQRRNSVKPLENIRSRLGKFFVTGSYDLGIIPDLYYFFINFHSTTSEFMYICMCELNCVYNHLEHVVFL